MKITRMIDALLLEAVRRRGIALEKLGFEGVIRFRETPFTSEEEYRHWWLPLRDDSGRIIRASLMSEKEKERYEVAAFHNLLTTAGRNSILTYLSSQSPNTLPFSQYFAVGTGAIINVFPGDTALQTELFRAAPSGATITGTQLDVSTAIGAAQGVATYTNAGLFGGQASATAGSGTLMTHALSNYTKPNGVVVVADYVLNVQ